MLVTRVVVPLGVRHTKVLLAAINKLLSKLLLELWVFSVDFRLCSHVVTILDFFFLSLAETLKMLL